MDLIELMSLPLEQVIRTFLLPFLILFAIVFAILTTLNIFKRKINIVVALGLTILASSTEQFTLFTLYLTQLGGQFALTAFFIVFILGVSMWALGRGREIYYEQLAPSGRLKKLYKDLEDEYKKLRRATNKAKKRAILRNIERLEKKIKLEESK